MPSREQGIGITPCPDRTASQREVDGGAGDNADRGRSGDRRRLRQSLHLHPAQLPARGSELGKAPCEGTRCKIRIGNKEGGGLKSGINEVSSTVSKPLWRQRGCSDIWNDQPFTF